MEATFSVVRRVTAPGGRLRSRLSVTLVEADADESITVTHLIPVGCADMNWQFKPRGSETLDTPGLVGRINTGPAIVSVLTGSDPVGFTIETSSIVPARTPIPFTISFQASVGNQLFLGTGRILDDPSIRGPFSAIPDGEQMRRAFFAASGDGLELVLDALAEERDIGWVYEQLSNMVGSNFEIEVVD